MGLDVYVFRAKTKKAFEDEHWYDDENTSVKEVWYARKFWDLIHNMSFIKNIEDDCGEYIQLTQDNIEEMIQFAAHNPDYWDGFDTVPALCKIYHDFEDDAENGWHYYFNYNY